MSVSDRIAAVVVGLLFGLLVGGTTYLMAPRPGTQQYVATQPSFAMP